MRKNIFKTLVSLAITTLALISCEKDPVLSTSVTELSFPKSGKSITVNITSDQEWTISAPEWITCTPESGAGNASVKFKASANEGIDREGNINITSSKISAVIKAVQSGVDFSLDRYAIEFDQNCTPEKVVVSSKFDWKITAAADASWCEVSPTEGKAGVTEVTLTPKPFTDRTPRNATFLTVSYGSTFSMVSISQIFPNTAPEAAILVSPTEGETDISIIHEFKWKAPKDPDGDVLTYNLKLSKDGGNKWSTTTSETTTTRPSIYLDKNTDYIWKVETLDPFGGVSTSATGTFRTGTKGTHTDGEARLYSAESAGAAKPVHLVFIGDGFIEEDFIDGGAFDKAVDRAVDALFGLEPFKSYKDYFRISTVAAYSQERGATVKNDMTNCKAMTRNTAFSATLEGGNTTATSCNYEKVFSYAKKVSGVTEEVLRNTTVFLLINLDVYAGTCMMEYSGRSVSMCPMGKSTFGPIVCHEGGGHGFGRLLDEYRYYDSQLPIEQKESIEYWRGGDPYYGYNISFTNDRNKVHWKHFFNIPGYEAVNTYEGACLYEFGVWRSEYISCMHDNRLYYDAPSREAIVRRIMRASGSTFDLNAFVAKDIIKSDPTNKSNAKRKSNYVEEAYPPLAPPILVNK